MSEKVKIEALRLKNFKGLGIQEAALEFDDLGNINLIKGPNESGKSRLLDAIAFSLTDGAKRAWIRTGDKGETEVLVQFSNGHKLQKKVTEKGTKVTLKDENDRTVDRKWIGDVVSDLGLDIGKFLDPKAWDYRREIIIKSAGLRISNENICEKIGFKFVPRISEGSDLFYKLERVEKEIREKRREANSALQQNELTMDRLSATIADADVDPDEIPGRKEEARQNYENLLKAQSEAIQQRTNKVNEMITEQEILITKLTQQLKEAKNKKAELVVNRDAAKEQIEAKFEADLEKARSAMDAIEEIEKRSASVQANKETLKVMRGQADESRTEKQEAEKALETLKIWQKEIVDSVAIKGLSFPDGEQDIFLDDVPWASANTAKQVSVAIRVAEGLCKSCPIILIDNSEHLDNATKFTLFMGMKKAGVQAFLAEVDDDPRSELRVETVDI